MDDNIYSYERTLQKLLKRVETDLEEDSEHVRKWYVQVRGQRIYSFECSTPERAHGKHAVHLRGRVRILGTLDTSNLQFGWVNLLS